VKELERPTEIVHVEFSPFEGLQLLTFLERLDARGEPETSVGALAEVTNRLSDAHALATWLRERVILELSTTEAAEVVKALQTNLGREDRPHETRAALQAVGCKLSGSTQRLT
jgi:hypothetical protein